MLEHRLYLAPEFSTLDEVEEVFPVYFDASTLANYAKCPRLYELKVLRGLGTEVKPRPMQAGTALHAAIDIYSITADPDVALETLREEWGDSDSSPTIDKFAHLTLAHLEVVLKNYIDYANQPAGMQYESVVFTEDDIDWKKVIAAKLRIHNGKIMFGESSWLMNIDVELPDGHIVTMPYAGKPDMLVRSTSNNLYIMDHKTTSRYLSDWYFESHRVSNQLRCYMGMVEELTGIMPHGGIVNGIYVGTRASKDSFKGTRFHPYKYNWDRTHVHEAFRNQYAWARAIDQASQNNYFPQVSTYACRGCDMGKICDREPALRDGVAYTDYEEVGWTNFFEI